MELELACKYGYFACEREVISDNFCKNSDKLTAFHGFVLPPSFHNSQNLVMKSSFSLLSRLCEQCDIKLKLLVTRFLFCIFGQGQQFSTFINTAVLLPQPTHQKEVTCRWSIFILNRNVSFLIRCVLSRLYHR